MAKDEDSSQVIIVPGTEILAVGILVLAIIALVVGMLP